MLSNDKGTAAKLKDYDDAEKLFENSTLATCITNAIESSISPENISGASGGANRSSIYQIWVLITLQVVTGMMKR